MARKLKWFITNLIEESRIQGDKRSLVWVNTRLIRASSPEQAYAKALKLGRISNRSYRNSDGQKVTWRFRGLIDLLPVYETIRDGAEILWADHGMMSEQKIKAMITPKKNLQVFGKQTLGTK